MIFFTPIGWGGIYFIYGLYKKKLHKQRNQLLSDKAASYEKEVRSFGFLITVKNYEEYKPTGEFPSETYSPEYNEYSLTFQSPLDFDFSIRKKTLKKRGITYYKEFDDSFILNCHDMTRLIALLNYKTRKLIIKLGWRRISDYQNSCNFRIYRSGIEIKANPYDGHLPEILKIMIELAKEITRSGSCKQMLLDNFNNKAEPPVVQAINLDKLLERYPEYKKNRVIVNKLKNTTDPWFEFITCKYELDNTIQSPEELQKIFNAGDICLRLEILSYIRKKIDPAYLDFLISACDTSSHEVLTAIFPIIEKIGDTRANDVLLKYVEHKDKNIRDAVIKALGPCGNVTAFSALRQIITWNPFLIKLIKRSLSQIQSRYNLQESALKGSLTLYEEDDSHKGALSISE